MEAIAAGAHEERGDTRERYLAGPLGDDVDAAADAAAGGDTVDERTRAQQQFDPLDEIGGNTIGGDKPVNAVQTDVACGHREAADLERVVESVLPGAGPDRRIVDQRIRRCSSLLVLDQLRRIVRRAERDIHHAPVSKEAKRSALRQLTACVGWRGSSDRMGCAHRRGCHACRHGTLARRPGRDAGRALRRATRPHGARHTCSLLRRIDGHRRQHLRRCALRAALSSSHTGQA